MSTMHPPVSTPRAKEAMITSADISRIIDSELDDLLQASEVSPEQELAPRRRLLHADELDDLPPLTWLVPGEIPANSLTALFGPSEGGKSFVALDYALRVAQQQNVIYIAAEGASGYAARKNAWRLHHKQGSGGLHFWLDAVNLLNPTAVQTFIDTITELSPALVIIDTLARCMTGGDENSAKDMGLAIDGCDAIRRATGATVLVVHHTGKHGTSERGSSALRGACDAMIELKNDDGLIELSCSKMKDSAPFPSRRLRLLPVGDSCVPVEADRVVVTKDAPLSENRRKVLETLSLAIFEEAGARSKDLQEAIIMPRISLFRALSDLKRLGYILQNSKGDPYYITEEGRQVLQREHEHSRSITNISHQNGQVSQYQFSISGVSDTPSISVSPVSHPLRGDTGIYTDTSDDTETVTDQQTKAVGAWHDH